MRMIARSSVDISTASLNGMDVAPVRGWTLSTRFAFEVTADASLRRDPTGGSGRGGTRYSTGAGSSLANCVSTLFIILETLLS